MANKILNEKNELIDAVGSDDSLIRKKTVYCETIPELILQIHHFKDKESYDDLSDRLYVICYDKGIPYGLANELIETAKYYAKNETAAATP